MKSAAGVSNVIGEVDTDAIARQLELACNANVEDVDANSGYVPIGNDSKRVMKLSFPPLPMHREQRTSKLAEHGKFMVR